MARFIVLATVPDEASEEYGGTPGEVLESCLAQARAYHNAAYDGGGDLVLDVRSLGDLNVDSGSDLGRWLLSSVDVGPDARG